MRFSLYYRGPLKANGGLKAKQTLRRKFHPQLKDLWGRLPLSGLKDLLSQTSESSVIKEIDNWKFSSIVNAKLYTLAELDITMLRPEAPGRLITEGGDIDNRLKTLLDALSIPRHPNQIPSGDSQSADETPLHCLLEDDNFIIGLSVSTDQLLNSQNPSEVVLIIRVDISAIVPTRGNLSLIT